MRDFSKLKSLDDWGKLDEPMHIPSERLEDPKPPLGIYNQRVLRMLVKSKYGGFEVPDELAWLGQAISGAWAFDYQHTGIEYSWCYVTVRRGVVEDEGDQEWHFDGASMRTDSIPERNYFWCDGYPLQYRMGELLFWPSFDPTIHDLFDYADKYNGVFKRFRTAKRGWNMITPFCFHRRDPNATGFYRTMVRITFTDIEIRDRNNTLNPELPAPSYGRDPVRTYRDKLGPWAPGDKVY